MSRRMITSEMWSDEFFTSLPYLDRLIWIGIITACADDQGRLQDSAALIRSKIFPLDDIHLTDIESALVRFAQAGKITRYVADNKNLIQIVTWWKHQTPRWAGKSNFKAPAGWVDRENFHTTGNKMVSMNWDSKGGYVACYVADCTINDVNVNDDVNDDVEDKQSAPSYSENSDAFDEMRITIQEITGLPIFGPDGIKAINDLLELGTIREDIQAGYNWIMSSGKKYRYPAQLVGPARTAMSKRLQKHPTNEPNEKLDITGLTVFYEGKPL